MGARMRRSAQRSAPPPPVAAGSALGAKSLRIRVPHASTAAADPGPTTRCRLPVLSLSLCVSPSQGLRPASLSSFLPPLLPHFPAPLPGGSFPLSLALALAALALALALSDCLCLSVRLSVCPLIPPLSLLARTISPPARGSSAGLERHSSSPGRQRRVGHPRPAAGRPGRPEPGGALAGGLGRPKLAGAPIDRPPARGVCGLRCGRVWGACQ
jgi:hypothetical protein